MIIYNFIKFLILYIRYNRILNKAYASENILEGLSKMLGTSLKQDWIGRVYAVINPYITDGAYDPTKVVTELGNDAPSDMVVEKFIMERLTAAQQYIRSSNLFDMLTYKIERIDDYENYLFTMYPIPFYDLVKWTKWFIGLISVLIAIGIILLIVL